MYVGKKIKSQDNILYLLFCNYLQNSKHKRLYVLALGQIYWNFCVCYNIWSRKVCLSSEGALDLCGNSHTEAGGRVGDICIVSH